MSWIQCHLNNIYFLAVHLNAYSAPQLFTSISFLKSTLLIVYSSTMSASRVMEDWHNPKTAELYQRAEAATGPFARAVIKQSGLPDYPSSAGPLVVFDNACGTGAVTAQLYDIVGSDKGMRVTCGDTAEGMIRYVEKRIERDGWIGAEAKIIDAVVSIRIRAYLHLFIFLSRYTQIPPHVFPARLTGMRSRTPAYPARPTRTSSRHSVSATSRSLTPQLQSAIVS